MNGNHFKLLKAEINAELKNLDHLIDELRHGQAYFGEDHSYFELRAYGSILHDFYSGLEKIFERIASSLDGDMPMGHDWHIQLLNRMGIEIETIRPKVISTQLQKELHEYMRFRHLFRKVYGFELKWDKMQPLIYDLPELLTRIKKELSSFINFLDEMYKNTTNQ